MTNLDPISLSLNKPKHTEVIDLAITLFKLRLIGYEEFIAIYHHEYSNDLKYQKYIITGDK